MPTRSARRSSPGNLDGKSRRSVGRVSADAPWDSSQLAAPCPPCYGSCRGGHTMNRHLAAIFAALAVVAAFPVHAQQPVKIGLIMPYSGQFADASTQMDNAIKLYMREHGDAVAGRKLEIIRRDTGGVAPDIAKRHAQELVVRDRIDILAGFVL